MRTASTIPSGISNSEDQLVLNLISISSSCVLSQIFSSVPGNLFNNSAANSLEKKSSTTIC